MRKLTRWLTGLLLSSAILYCGGARGQRDTGIHSLPGETSDPHVEDSFLDNNLSTICPLSQGFTCEQSCSSDNEDTSNVIRQYDYEYPDDDYEFIPDASCGLKECCPPTRPGSPPPRECPRKCVHFTLCDADGFIVTDGEGNVDIRQIELNDSVLDDLRDRRLDEICTDPLAVCCSLKEDLEQRVDIKKPISNLCHGLDHDCVPPRDCIDGILPPGYIKQNVPDELIRQVEEDFVCSPEEVCCQYSESVGSDVLDHIFNETDYDDEAIPCEGYDVTCVTRTECENGFVRLAYDDAYDEIIANTFIKRQFDEICHRDEVCCQYTPEDDKMSLDYDDGGESCEGEDHMCVRPDDCENGFIRAAYEEVIHEQFIKREFGEYCHRAEVCCEFPREGFEGHRTPLIGVCTGHQVCVSADQCAAMTGVSFRSLRLRLANVTCKEPSKCCDMPTGADVAPARKCGIRHDTLDIREVDIRNFDLDIRIMGTPDALDKTATVHGEWPHVCMLQDGSGSFVGGASLIAPGIVLTGARYSGTAASSRFVVCGIFDGSLPNEKHRQTREVSRIISHPGFDRKWQYDNWALLFTSRDFDLNYFVSPICLPSSRDVEFDKDTCFVAGWGKNKFNNSFEVGSGPLKQIELPLRTHAYCESELRKTRLGGRFKLHPSFVCAGGYQGEDTCTGDGGSPLMCRRNVQSDKNETWIQVGITSWGIGCGAADRPGVYADVTRGNGMGQGKEAGGLCFIDAAIRCEKPHEAVKIGITGCGGGGVAWFDEQITRLEQRPQRKKVKDQLRAYRDIRRNCKS